MHQQGDQIQPQGEGSERRGGEGGVQGSLTQQAPLCPSRATTSSLPPGRDVSVLADLDRHEISRHSVASSKSREVFLVTESILVGGRGGMALLIIIATPAIKEPRGVGENGAGRRSVVKVGQWLRRAVWHSQRVQGCCLFHGV